MRPCRVAHARYRLMCGLREVCYVCMCVCCWLPVDCTTRWALEFAEAHYIATSLLLLYYYNIITITIILLLLRSPCVIIIIIIIIILLLLLLYYYSNYYIITITISIILLLLLRSACVAELPTSCHLCPLCRKSTAQGSDLDMVSRLRRLRHSMRSSTLDTHCIAPPSPPG